MAGKPGKSGGARPGAGRKPKAPAILAPSTSMLNDPKGFLLAVMSDPANEARMRIDAAKALMPYMHEKVAEPGKKDAKRAAAKTAGKGKFAPAAPPKLAFM